MGSLLCTCVREDLVISDVKYAIISKIADGGFGVISLVENTRDGKQYALKQIKCESRKEADVMLLENKYYNRLNSHSNLSKLRKGKIASQLRNGVLITFVLSKLS